MKHFPSVFEGYQEFLLQEVLESIDDAVIVFGSDHKIAYANAAAADVFEGHADSLTGKSIKHLIPKDQTDYFENIVNQLDSSANHSVELRGKKEFIGLRTNGRTFYAEGKLAKLKQDLSYILILRDITWRKVVEDELKTVLGHFNETGQQLEYRFEHPRFLE